MSIRHYPDEQLRRRLTVLRWLVAVCLLLAAVNAVLFVIDPGGNWKSLPAALIATTAATYARHVVHTLSRR